MVADDAVLIREGLSRVLVDAGFEVTAQVGGAPALLDRVREDPPESLGNGEQTHNMRAARAGWP